MASKIDQGNSGLVELTSEELELLRNSNEDHEVEAVSADLAEAGLL